MVENGSFMLAYKVYTYLVDTLSILDCFVIVDTAWE